MTYDIKLVDYCALSIQDRKSNIFHLSLFTEPPE